MGEMDGTGLAGARSFLNDTKPFLRQSLRLSVDRDLCIASVCVCVCVCVAASCVVTAACRR